jgi:hypothetical protein
MDAAMGRLNAFLWRNLGHCMKCMRTSLLLAACAWMLLLANTAVGWPQYELALGLAVFALSGLWAAATARVTRRLRNQVADRLRRWLLLPLRESPAQA